MPCFCAAFNLMRLLKQLQPWPSEKKKKTVLLFTFLLFFSCSETSGVTGCKLNGKNQFVGDGVSLGLFFF